MCSVQTMREAYRLVAFYHTSDDSEESSKKTLTICMTATSGIIATDTVNMSQPRPSAQLG